MSELRQNMASKEWVIIASERAQRPSDFAAPDREPTEKRPEWEKKCPFCPGNEEPELELSRFPDTESWQIRVVQNKFPALSREGQRLRSFDDVHRRISGVGAHEVLIETPRHNTCPALESVEEIALMLRIFQERGQLATQDDRIEHIIYFKNHGQRAGTSLVHPHTQLVGLPVVPYSIRSRVENARRFFDDTGTCVYCQMLQDEYRDGSRLVAESDYFIAFVPYAAFTPFHLWIIPQSHRSDFLDSTPEELEDLSTILRHVLRKLYFGLNDPDYNYVIRTAPIRDAHQEFLHWYMTIVPRVSSTAGFELGSGMFINTTLPEADAKFLRSVKTDD